MRKIRPPVKEGQVHTYRNIYQWFSEERLHVSGKASAKYESQELKPKLKESMKNGLSLAQEVSDRRDYRRLFQESRRYQTIYT